MSEHSRNPFDDPETPTVADSTITIGRDVSLTLGTDSLVVLDENFQRRRRQSLKEACCGLLRAQQTLSTHSIPFYNILWVELTDLDLNIRYARPISKTVVRVANINYMVEKNDRTKVSTWVDVLLDKAYGRSQRQKRIKILINPFGGQRLAQSRFLQDIEPILAAARCDLDVENTKYSGHACEIAEKLDVDAFDVVGACSGDGVPHEVINGFGRRPDAARALAKVAISQLPCGSGNALSWNVNGTNSPSLAALALVKGLRTPLDLVSVTQGDKRTLSFLSQAHGMVAEVDLGTDDIRWMGETRFTYGFLTRLLGKTVYPCDLAVKVIDDSKASIKRTQQEASEERAYAARNQQEDVRANDALATEFGLPKLRYGTVNDPLPDEWQLKPYPTMGTFYAGNMPFMAANANFFPAALPCDGALDLIMIDGHVSRLKAMQCLLAVENGTFFDMSQVHYAKIEAYRINPKPRDGKKGYISIDGESVPFEPFQVEVHRGLGTVLSKSGNSYEAPKLK